MCFCAKQADGRTLARDPVLLGSRADVRDRSVAVAMHMLRVLLRGEEPLLDYELKNDIARSSTRSGRSSADRSG